jgi:2-methylisocitrate lyase-like PEP mutase family enzyme
VDGIGERRVSLIGLPGTPPQADLVAAGVARLSFGPWSQRIAMTALAETGAELLAGASLPDGVLALT